MESGATTGGEERTECRFDTDCVVVSVSCGGCSGTCAGNVAAIPRSRPHECTPSEEGPLDCHCDQAFVAVCLAGACVIRDPTEP